MVNTQGKLTGVRNDVELALYAVRHEVSAL